MKRLEFCCDLFVNGSGLQTKNNCYKTQNVEDDYKLSLKDVDYTSIETENSLDSADDCYYHTRLVDEDGIEIDNVGFFQKDYLTNKKSINLLNGLYEKCEDAGDCRTSYEFLFENDCLEFSYAFLNSYSWSETWRIDFENTIDSLKEIEKDIRYFSGYKAAHVVTAFKKTYENYGEITESFEETLQASHEVLKNSLCNLVDKVEDIIAKLEAN